MGKKKKRLIKGVLVDVKRDVIEKVTIEDNLDTFYKMLNCDTIDIVTRKINGVNVAIVCDDEGLWKDEQIVSVFTYANGSIVEEIVNNVLIFSAETDEDGNMESLDDEEIIRVLAKQCNYSLHFQSHKAMVANI